MSTGIWQRGESPAHLNRTHNWIACRRCDLSGAQPSPFGSGILVDKFALRALAFSVFVLVPPWWIVAGAIFLGPVAREPVNPLLTTIIQEHIPSGLRGRVSGLAGAISVSALPVGIIVYGHLLDGIGLEPTLVIFVVANLIVMIAMALNPVLRHLTLPERGATLAL